MPHPVRIAARLGAESPSSHPLLKQQVWLMAGGDILESRSSKTGAPGAPRPVVGTGLVAACSKRRPTVTAPPLTVLSALDRHHIIETFENLRQSGDGSGSTARAVPVCRRAGIRPKRPLQPAQQNLRKSMMMPQGQWHLAPAHSCQPLGPFDCSRKQS